MYDKELFAFRPVLEYSFFRAEKRYAAEIGGSRYEIIGADTGMPEKMLIALGGSGKVFIVDADDGSAVYAAENEDVFLRELAAFETFIGSEKIPSRSPYTAYKAAAERLRKTLLSLDVNALSDPDGFWAAVCDEAEQGMIF